MIKHRLMSIGAALIGLVLLAGCEFVKEFAPNTHAGFEAGGVIGALQGGAGAVVVQCKRLDGELVTLTIDGVAAAAEELSGLSATDLVDKVRERRRRFCRGAGFLTP